MCKAREEQQSGGEGDPSLRVKISACVKPLQVLLVTLLQLAGGRTPVQRRSCSFIVVIIIINGLFGCRCRWWGDSATTEPACPGTRAWSTAQASTSPRCGSGRCCSRLPSPRCRRELLWFLQSSSDLQKHREAVEINAFYLYIWHSCAAIHAWEQAGTQLCAPRCAPAATPLLLNLAESPQIWLQGGQETMRTHSRTQTGFRCSSPVQLC